MDDSQKNTSRHCRAGGNPASCMVFTDIVDYRLRGNDDNQDVSDRTCELSTRTSEFNCRLLHILTLVLVFGCALPSASAQVLSGQWVKQQQERIDRYRKGDIRVIVLDAQGRSVAGAQIHVAMQRHDFHFGVRLDPSRFKDQTPFAIPQAEQPIWRLLNAVSIEETARWNRLEPKQGEYDWTASDRMLNWAAQHQMAVHWGQVVSMDVSHLPVWLTKLDDDALTKALDEHVAVLSRKLAGRAISWDVITRLPDHHYVQDRLGKPMARRLLGDAAMLSPRTAASVRFNDTLAGQRLTDMVQALTELRDLQAPVTSVTMDVKLGGNVAYVSLERSLEWLTKLGLPINMMNVEVAGSSPQGAAINLETTLRTFFAQPQIKGIWLGGIDVKQVLDPSSALVNKFNLLTASGELFTKMVGTEWWTDEIIKADELGNARLRVFAGGYKIQAVWPGGQAATAAYVRPGNRTQLIVIQQLARNLHPNQTTPDQTLSSDATSREKTPGNTSP